MICKDCGKRKAIRRGLCDPCCVRDWRKKNPEKVRAYAQMRRIRDADKIHKYQYEHRDKNNFGGNRELALKRDNYTCQFCGKTKEDGKKIIVHHKDGNGWAKKNMNNRLDNLITLCVQCHMDIHIPSQYRKKKIETAFLNNTKEEKR